MVNVPPKITPEQLRGSGGQLVVVNDRHGGHGSMPNDFNSQVRVESQNMRLRNAPQRLRNAIRSLVSDRSGASFGLDPK